MKKHLWIVLPALVLLAACKDKNEGAAREKVSMHGLEGLVDTSMAPFYHGVASGDPLSYAVVIWTRVTPEYHQRVDVKWEMATDSAMTDIIQSGEATVDAAVDYTVKVDVRYLEANHFYYYRFHALGKTSVTGRTKTLPDDNAHHVRIAFASCSNYAWGYFNAYNMMAKDTLDAVVHLGDYIYEHEEGVYARKDFPRRHIPKTELLGLDDYRTRYAQYRLDKDLQNVHAHHPFIAVWDDHELANNAYDDGAQNHQQNEGKWSKRMEDAKRAYYEWLPVRGGDSKLYRSFEIGKLANLMMLDTRVGGRTAQVPINGKLYADSTRKIIDDKQFNWLCQELDKPVKWRIIGNQVLFGPLQVFFSRQGDLYADGWDDYPYQKQKLLEKIARKTDVIIVTGDFHSSSVLENTMNGEVEAMEYVVPSISAANYDEDLNADSARVYTGWYTKANPNLRYVNLTDHGYFVLDITRDRVKRIFKYVSTVTDRAYTPMKEVIFE